MWVVTRSSIYSDLTWKLFISILENWSLRRGGCLRELVTTMRDFKVIILCLNILALRICYWTISTVKPWFNKPLLFAVAIVRCMEKLPPYSKTLWGIYFASLLVFRYIKVSLYEKRYLDKILVYQKYDICNDHFILQL